MAEEWRPVIGFEGWYEASSLGRIRRIKHGKSTHEGKILKPTARKNRRLAIYFCRNGIQTSKEMAVVVAEAFMGRRPDGKEINHIDGNPANNSVANLEYCTRSENIAHAYRLGLMKANVGVDVPWSKLTNEQVMVIRGCQNVPTRVLARVFGVKHATIRQIQRLKTWRHV